MGQQKTVSIWRSRTSGEFVVHPLAIFGDGAFELPAAPLRMLASGVEPEALGKTVLAALERTDKVDWDFRDWASYWKTTDAESARLFVKLGFRRP